jgi:hypothetical protein
MSRNVRDRLFGVGETVSLALLTVLISWDYQYSVSGRFGWDLPTSDCHGCSGVRRSRLSGPSLQRRPSLRSVVGALDLVTRVRPALSASCWWARFIAVNDRLMPGLVTRPNRSPSTSSSWNCRVFDGRILPVLWSENHRPLTLPRVSLSWRSGLLTTPVAGFFVDHLLPSHSGQGYASDPVRAASL